MAPEELMKKVAEAFGKGNMRPLLDAVHDDVVWRSGSFFEGIFRFGGQYRKRIGVFDVTLQAMSVFFFRRIEPIEIVSKGNVVWGLFEVEADFLPTGNHKIAQKPVNFLSAIRWVMRDGKIAEHHSFFDTAGLLLQQGELGKPALFPLAREAASS